MGDNSDKKKKRGHLLFHEESICESKNISVHGSKNMLCTRKRDKQTNEYNKATRLNGQKLQRAITLTTFHLIG